MSIKLISRYGFNEMGKELKKVLSNGCGSTKSKFDFVPDTFYGLNISEACNCHDIDYLLGVSYRDKVDADLDMRRNLIIIIEANSTNGWFSQWLKRRRIKRAETYRFFVDNFGVGSFFDKDVRRSTKNLTRRHKETDVSPEWIELNDKDYKWYCDNKINALKLARTKLTAEIKAISLNII